MRPIRLTLEAFGSYEKKTVIDFTELKDRSFFLIHGRTGSGKTTLLDAMCFAFYGDTSMTGRTGTMMRTDEAPRDVQTSVDFIFSLHDKKYHICRKPSYERLKKDGSGMTTVQGSAILLQMMPDEKEQVIAERPLAVTQKMTEILGFGSAEFRQVVLLPQGAFRDLLTAKVEDREALLAMLFKTERYRRLEQLLKKRAEALKTRREEIKMQEKALFIGSGEETLEELVQARKAKEKLLVELEKQAGLCKEHHEAAQRAEQKGLQEAKLLLRLEQAQKDRAAHEKKRGDVDRYIVQLEKARRAAQIEDVADSVYRDLKKLKVHEAKCEAAKKSCQQAADVLKQAKERAAEEKMHEGALAACKEKEHKLAEYASKAEELTKASQHAKSCKQIAEQMTVQKEQKKAAKEDIAARLLALSVREKELVAQAARVKGLSLELAQKEKERELSQHIATLKEKLAQAEKAATNAREAASKALQVEKAKKKSQRALEIVYMEAQAALLARDLKDGEPCSVCGSTIHPHPFLYVDVVPEKEEVERAREAAEKAEKARAQAEKLQAVKEAALAAIGGELLAAQKSLLPCSKDIASIDDAVFSLQTALKSAKMAAQAQKEAASERETLTVLLTKAEAAEKEATKKAEKAEHEAAQAVGVLQEKRAALPTAYRKPKILQEMLASVKKEITEREKMQEMARIGLIQAEKTLAAALAGAKAKEQAASFVREEAKNSNAVFAARLKAAGFANEAAFRAVLQGVFATEQGRKDVADRIRAYENTQTALDEAEKKATLEAAGIVRPDLEKLKTARENAALSWSESTRKAATLAQEIKERKGRENALQKLAAETATLEALYHTTGRLAEVATGQNAHRMHFQTYVLRSILADVTDAANQRLLRMTNGQYRLERKEGVSDMRKNSGLDLEVFDENTGYARPMATLSGGESFLAALALALGLADVITSYAGGIRLDTIFIDEGFGSLDAETLDLAIKTLMELQKGGRLVGIISHVEELKSRIDVRLEVEKGKSGSHARFVM